MRYHAIKITTIIIIMRPYPLKGLKVLYNNNKLEGQKGQNTGNENAYDA